MLLSRTVFITNSKCKDSLIRLALVENFNRVRRMVLCTKSRCVLGTSKYLSQYLLIFLFNCDTNIRSAFWAFYNDNYFSVFIDCNCLVFDSADSCNVAEPSVSALRTLNDFAFAVIVWCSWGQNNHICLFLLNSFSKKGTL
jgi:hypothetical protein